VETFVIRLWRPAEPDDDAEHHRLRGVAEHVSTGERQAFRSASELLAFLKAPLEINHQEVQQ
jgi:hypothetical protein